MEQGKRVELIAQIAASQQIDQLLADGYADAVSSLAAAPDELELELLAQQQRRLVLMSRNPAAYPECCAYPWAIWCGNGLDELARLRDDWPQLQWIPRIEVEKQALRYSFPRSHDEATFKCYVLDSTSVNAFVVPGEGDKPVGEVLERAEELGFNALWIHAPDAEQRALGLPLELLEKARNKWREELWLSGGVAETRHLDNLVRQGGADAVVIPAGWVLGQTPERLQELLEPVAAETPENTAKVEIGLPQRDSA